jgi:hypothetical protein
MHHVDEQSIELDFIIEIQKNILGSDVDSSCIAGLSANIRNYIILNLCYQVLLSSSDMKFRGHLKKCIDRCETLSTHCLGDFFLGRGQCLRQF